MSDKVDYSNELTEIVVGLKDSLDKCITLITKISGENTNLKESNVTLNTKLDELTQEMANYTKVSFVSNLSKQISEKDYQIVTLKKKLCKLESENSELVKEKEKIKITPNEDIIIEVGENNLDKPERNVSHVKKFIDSLNNTLETENNMEERDDTIENDDEHEVDNNESNSEEDQDQINGEEEVEDNESEGEEEQGISDEEPEDNESEEEETLDSDEEQEDEDESEDEESDGEKEGTVNGDEEPEPEDEESDGEEVEFEIIKIKKKKYYLSNEQPQGVYVIEADDDVGDRIGDFIDKKLVKSTS